MVVRACTLNLFALMSGHYRNYLEKCQAKVVKRLSHLLCTFIEKPLRPMRRHLCRPITRPC
jgi:hypothetical protein